MAEQGSVEGILSSLDESDSRMSFLHLTEDKGDTSPLPESSCKLQLEHLEDRLREYAVLLKARDKELSAIYKDVSFSPLPTLEDESPTQAKVAQQLRGEVERLRGEIRSVNSAIASYEQKLTDTASRLHDLEVNQSSSFLFCNREKVSDLLKKISLFQHANGDLQQQVEETKSALESAQKDCVQLKQWLVPSLQAQLAVYERQRDNLKSALEAAKASLRTSSRCSLAPGLSSPPVPVLAKSSATVSPKQSPRATPALPRDTPTLHRPAGEYIPSFLRPRKPTKATQPKARK